MKIIILQDYLRPGGTERQALFLARYLGETGHQVQLITFRPGGIITSVKRGIDHRCLQVIDTGIDWLGIGVSEAIQDNSPDGILCMGRVANAYAGILQARFPRVRVISSVRTGKKLPFLYRWSLRKTKHIIVNSNWWKNQLVGEGVNTDKVSVVHNPLTLDYNEISKEVLRTEIRQRYIVQPGTCVFICAQEFRLGKRHMDLIHYFSGCSREQDWRLWLLGDGKERRKCEGAVKKLGLTQRIKFMGFVEDPIPFYAGADVAVSVSQEDSLPNFLIEAQAMGLPVIALDCKGVKEAFVPGITGFLLPRSQPHLFVELASRLMQDSGLRQEMADAGRLYSREKFSPTRQAAQTVSILQSVLKKKISLQPKKIVLSRPDRIGDVVVTATCFEAIKSTFPEVELYVIVQDYIHPLLANHPLIKKIISLENGNSNTSDIIQNLLRHINPCCLVHLHYNQLIEDSARKAGVTCRIGYSSRKSSLGLTAVLPDKKKQCKKHEADYNFDLLNLIGVNRPVTLNPSMSPDPNTRHSLLAKCPWLKRSSPYVTLHLTAHGKKMTVSPDLFVELICWLHKDYHVNIVLTGNEKHHPTLNHVYSVLGKKPWIFDTIGTLNLAELAWLLKESFLTIGRDSGVTHISAAMGTPTYTIMMPLGKTLNSKRWHPLGPRSRFFEKQIFPYPLESIKRYQQRYAQSITFDDVKDEIVALLEESKLTETVIPNSS